MKCALLVAAASLALTVPTGTAIAQDTTVARDAAGNTVVLTAEQQVLYDGWPAERRTSYDTWPDTYRVYYWTLTPDQQAGWWALTDEQRGQVYAMTPEQRTAAWASIATQMGAAPAAPAAMPAPATTPMPDMAAPTATAPTTTAPTTTADADAAVAATAAPSADASWGTTTAATSGTPQFTRREMVQPVQSSADPAALQSGDLPACTRGQQDGCINSWDKNRTGNRPLDHWPGRPASEGQATTPDD